jgi:dihydrofolate synthase/folylpolyglutamate synthase
MDYQQTIRYLYEHLPMFQRIGAAAYKPDLSRTIEICHRLGNPEKKFKSIHVAGTNGKGSVSHMLASVLQEQGYKTGLYTSPHLKDFRERIKINGHKIPEQKVVEFVESNQARLQDIQPSFFEYTFGMAVEYFNREKVDFAIMETGMGGRLDSTNVVHPVISVITNIGFDHMQFLGDTLEKIAVEKAGIIKKNVPVVIGETQKETQSIFVETAYENKSSIQFADQKFDIRGFRNTAKLKAPVIELDLYDRNAGKQIEIVCPLTGKYQTKNIQTALLTLITLSQAGYPVEEENIRKGFNNVVKNTGLLGRWQILSSNPLTICDTAHNVDGMKAVMGQIQELNYNRLHMVFGVVNDKNIDGLLRLLPPQASYYFCKADIPRGMNVDELRQKASELNLQGFTYASVLKACQAARENACKNDVIFIGGSTFVVAEVL